MSKKKHNQRVGNRKHLRVGLAALLLIAPLATHAATAVRYAIRHASQLEDDKAVRLFKERYIAVSTAHVVYTECAEPLRLTPAQQAFITKHFNDVSAGYLNAYNAAFQARVGAGSPKAMVEEYIATMHGIQQTAVNNAAKTIHTQGCNHRDNHKLIRYYNTLQQQEEIANPPVAEEVPPTAVATPVAPTPQATPTAPSSPATTTP